jgi:hypothetical protein
MFVLGVCFRGPSPPATRMPLSVQLENARLAGAEAVIFINHDPAVSDLGAVEYSQEDLCAVSQGPLPMGVVLNTSCKMLQMLEGLTVEICGGRAGSDGGGYGGRLDRGRIVVPIQNERAQLSKVQADELLTEFCEERREERRKELLPQGSDKGGGRGDRPQQAQRTHFWGKVMAEGIVDQTLKREVVSELGIAQLKDTMKSLRQDLHRMLPWKPGADASVWAIQGPPPFSVNFTLGSGDVALHLRVQEPDDCGGSLEDANHKAFTIVLNSVTFSPTDPFGKWGAEAATSYIITGDCGAAGASDMGGGRMDVSKDGVVALVVSADGDGFHVGWQGGFKFFFRHRVAWDADAVASVSLEVDNADALASSPACVSTRCVFAVCAVCHLSRFFDPQPTAPIHIYAQSFPFSPEHCLCLRPAAHRKRCAGSCRRTRHCCCRPTTRSVRPCQLLERRCRLELTSTRLKRRGDVCMARTRPRARTVPASACTGGPSMRATSAPMSCVSAL